MAAAACLSDVSAIDRRLRITRGQDGRHVTISGVTIDTRRRLVSALNCLCVKTTVVGRVHVRMKLRLTQIWQSFTRSVTTLAIKSWSCGSSGRGACRRGLRVRPN